MGGGRELIIAIDRKFWKWIFQSLDEGNFIVG